MNTDEENIQFLLRSHSKYVDMLLEEHVPRKLILDILAQGIRDIASPENILKLEEIKNDLEDLIREIDER